MNNNKGLLEYKPTVFAGKGPIYMFASLAHCIKSTYFWACWHSKA